MSWGWKKRENEEQDRIHSVIQGGMARAMSSNTVGCPSSGDGSVGGISGASTHAQLGRERGLEIYERERKAVMRVEFTRPRRESHLPSRPCGPSCVGASWKPRRSVARNLPRHMRRLFVCQ